MTVFQDIIFRTPMLRVCDKDKNIAFYQENLGMKLVTEENALAIFGAYEDKTSCFIIEESPAYRTRAVSGVKKLHRLAIKAASAEIEQLLARLPEVEQVYQGENGYAFEVISPEGDRILLHSETNLTGLKSIDRPELALDLTFKGLSSYQVSQVSLNVLDPEVAAAFYTEVFGQTLPVQLDFIKADGADLQVAPNETWDLEVLQFVAPATYELEALRDKLLAKGHEVFLGNKQKLLVVADTSQIEVWIEKI